MESVAAPHQSDAVRLLCSCLHGRLAATSFYVAALSSLRVLQLQLWALCQVNQVVGGLDWWLGFGFGFEPQFLLKPKGRKTDCIMLSSSSFPYCLPPFLAHLSKPVFWVGSWNWAHSAVAGQCTVCFQFPQLCACSSPSFQCSMASQRASRSISVENTSHTLLARPEV